MNSAAVAAAIQAAYIQSGVSAKADALRQYVEARARQTAEIYHIEKPLSGVVFVARTYRNGMLELPVDRNKRIRVFQNRIELEVTW